MTGQLVCGSHGGRNPKAKAAAARRTAEAATAALAVTYGLPVKVDPIDALLGELYRTQGVVLWLESQVRGLTPEALTWGPRDIVEKTATEFPGIDRSEAAAIHGLVELYQRERAHLTKVSTDCVKVGVVLKDQHRMEQIGAFMVDRLQVLAAAVGLDVGAPATVALVSHVLQFGAPPAREALEA